MRKYISGGFKIITTLAILYLLFINIDFSKSDFLLVWGKINIGYLVLSLPAVVLVLAVKSFRWNGIISAENFVYPFYKSFGAYMASYSIGIVTPGRLGELLKVYNIRKEIKNIDFITAFRTVVLDRLFDLFFLGWFGLSGVFFYFNVLGSKNIWLIIIIAFSILFLSLIIGYVLSQILFEKYQYQKVFIHFIYNCFSKMLSGNNIYAWIASAIAYAIYFTAIKVLFLSLGIHINYIEVGFIISLIGLVLLLPISIAGFGTREAGLVYLLSFYGIKAEVALSFSLIQFLTFFVFGGLLGLYYWVKVPTPFNMIKEDTKKMFYLIRPKNA